MLTAAQRELALAILDAASDLTIATNREDGWPQATTVSFVHDGLKLYFGTWDKSQKARNIVRDDRVSVTVDAPYANWEQIKSISLAGRARRVTSPDEVMLIGKLMLAKFPEVQSYIPSDGSEMALFCVEPEIISILDYTRGFGHSELVDVKRAA